MNESQDALIYDGLRDALGQVARVVGVKRLACEMRPQLSADKAAGWLRDCLSDARREKLDIEDIEYILRRGREAGCHVAIRQLARDCGYTEPAPIEPEDERAQLQREFIAAVKAQQKLAARLEALT